MKTEQEIREQIKWEINRQNSATELGCKYINAQCEGALWALEWVLREENKQ